ncbi:hypothetical protein M3Y97_00826200 [Aphelenchoides bicaudatus]|nr:hypothetical protein M3Y97_00826200 [Aphelenchoides bicaudatus]
MTDGNYSGESYDQVVYYVAPAVLVAAILFCCFRMALVYYMQIRPRRNQSTVHTTSTREEIRAGTIPAACQEIFARVPPPPNYEQTLKNDRRCMSTIETSPRRNSNRRPTEVVINVENVQQETAPDRSTTARNTLRRAQSNVEASLSINAAPPSYSERTECRLKL